MKDQISIKVNIADVSYPLKITAEEEENIRKAAKMLNEKIKSYTTNYQINDKNMLLSMISLELASELQLYKDKDLAEGNGLTDKLKQINDLLDETLKGA